MPTALTPEREPLPLQPGGASTAPDGSGMEGQISPCSCTPKHWNGGTGPPPSPEHPHTPHPGPATLVPSAAKPPSLSCASILPCPPSLPALHPSLPSIPPCLHPSLSPSLSPGPVWSYLCTHNFSRALRTDGRVLRGLRAHPALQGGRDHGQGRPGGQRGDGRAVPGVVAARSLEENRDTAGLGSAARSAARQHRQPLPGEGERGAASSPQG